MPKEPKKIRIPVKLTGGRWEFFYGGEVKARNGTIGELRIDLDHIDDPEFLALLTAKNAVRVLDQGAELRVALSVNEDLPADLRKHLIASNEMRSMNASGISIRSRFVKVLLAGPTEIQKKRELKAGGLWLNLEGMEPRSMESGEVLLPGIPGLEKAESLNHAFTLLSEVFEPWRISHTGNVYDRIFYRDQDANWYPLGDLRQRELASAEREVIARLWDSIQERLGASF